MIYNNGKGMFNTIHSNATARDEIWQACITPNDGTEDGTTSCSNNLTILNAVPTQGTPILNSTLGTNKSSENLTVYNVSTADFDDDKVTNIINWYRNGSSIAVLNMPFDTNYSNSSLPNIIRDYSGYGNNGTGGNGTSSATPRWNSSGILGGAYSFDGGDYVEVPDDPSLNFGTGDFTVEAWIYIDSLADEHNRILTKYNNGSANEMGFIISIHSGKLTSYIGMGGETLPGVNTLSTGSWYHIVLVRSGNNAYQYINGTLDKSGSGLSSKIASSSSALGIAGKPSDSYYFNGLIDEIKMYNVSFTAAQIQANYNQGIAKHNMIESSMAARDEIWQTCITPNDGTEDGTTSCSNNLTILNAVPTQGTPILNSTFGTNKSSENLTVYNVSTSDIDNDKVKNIVNWYRNASSLAILNLPFDTNYSNHSMQLIIKDYSGYGNNASAGNVSANTAPAWNSTCISGSCYQFDGSNDFINISNSNNLNTRIISAEAWIQRYDSGVDTIISRNNALEYQINAAGKLDCIIYTPGSTTVLGVTVLNALWHHVACVYDGSNISIYVDGALDNITAKTGDMASNTRPITIGGHENGNQYFNGLIDEVKIYNFSLTPQQIAANYNAGAPRYSLIDSSMTKFGENWNASITPNDGYEDGETLFSNNLTINSPPRKVTLVSPQHGNSRNLTNRTIIFSWLPTTDGDGDAVTYNLTVRCYSTLGGSCSPTDDRSVSGITSTSYMLTSELAFLRDDNYYYNWTITPYDNKDFGEYSNQSNLSIISYVNINLSNDRVDFGSLTINTNQSTTDDSPTPLTIDNIGNVRVEVNLSSSRLFTTDSFPSPNYMFRVRNRTDYPNAFNSSSNTSFANVPNISARIMYQFNYTNGTNSAYIDINITVPPNEPAATLSSILTFIGKYVG